VCLPANQAVATTASRTMVSTEDGLFHIGVENLQTGAPGLFTVVVKNSTNKMIPLDQECVLYQLAYDEEENVLYGMNVQATNAITLFTIDMRTGKTNEIGTFPLHINLIAKKRVGECYEVLGGATILDSDTKLLYLYYSSGTALYYEVIDIKTATVADHGNFQYDLASCVFGDDYNTVYALDIGPSPAYKKSFAVYDVPTARITRMNDIPYWVYYDNESAYVADKKIYTTIMLANISTTATTLVSIDVNTGTVLFEPSYTSGITWGLKYADF